ncbi:hypothetical protein GKZ90_0011340 [Flavobacterium sp. MC2016-06]|jgi:hypothetical protein|uniref:hypothetical protein n=1 Tax=Flavobacterium sp. MC2016-06 TaxID=2676308 RepID=UPI0012BA7D7C|nr:hypothetical protein [Flavobacterium sp. MC2016-06]MBU3858697.1 hypothetical protein [Flavobacterium sp. MC2016-06]
MNVKDKYGLKFLKEKNVENVTYCFCNYIQSENFHSVALILNQLKEFELESFIEELDWCIENKNNGNTGFFSDSVEFMQINYNYPDVNINDLGDCIIDMHDLKIILEEWRIFKNS